LIFDWGTGKVFMFGLFPITSDYLRLPLSLGCWRGERRGKWVPDSEISSQKYFKASISDI